MNGVQLKEKDAGGRPIAREALTYELWDGHVVRQQPVVRPGPFPQQHLTRVHKMKKAKVHTTTLRPIRWKGVVLRKSLPERRDFASTGLEPVAWRFPVGVGLVSWRSRNYPTMPMCQTTGSILYGKQSH
jgi:hypothetical protein